MQLRIPALAIAVTALTVACFLASAYLYTAFSISGYQVFTQRGTVHEDHTVRILGADLQPVKGIGGIVGNRTAVITGLQENEAILRAPINRQSLGFSSVKIDANLNNTRVNTRVLVVSENSKGANLIAESVSDPVGSESFLAWYRDPNTVESNFAVLIVFSGESNSAHIALDAIELIPSRTTSLFGPYLALWTDLAGQRNHVSMNRTVHAAAKLKLSLSEVSFFASLVVLALVLLFCWLIPRSSNFAIPRETRQKYLAIVLLLTLGVNLGYWTLSNANNLISRLTASGIFRVVFPNTLAPINEHISFSEEIKTRVIPGNQNKIWIVSDHWNNYAAYRFSYLLLPINNEIVYYNRTLCRLSPQIESSAGQYAAFSKGVSPPFEFDGTFLKFYNAKFKANLVFAMGQDGYLFHLTEPNIHPCNPDL